MSESKTFHVFHNILCECGADLTQAESIEVSFSCGEHIFEKLSQVTPQGELDDVDRLISCGYHSASCCKTCGEQIDDFPEPCSIWHSGMTWFGLLKAIEEMPIERQKDNVTVLDINGEFIGVHDHLGTVEETDILDKGHQFLTVLRGDEG